MGTLNSEAQAKNIKTLTESRILRYNAQLDTSLRTEPTGMFEIGEETGWDDINDEIRAYEKALSSANEYISTLTTFGIAFNLANMSAVKCNQYVSPFPAKSSYDKPMTSFNRSREKGVPFVRTR